MGGATRSWIKIQVFWYITPCRLVKVTDFRSSLFCVLWTTVKMQAVSSFEKSVFIYQLIRRHIPEYLNLHQHGCENLKSLYIVYGLCFVFYVAEYYSPCKLTWEWRYEHPRDGRSIGLIAATEIKHDHVTGTYWRHSAARWWVSLPQHNNTGIYITVNICQY
jgi:hypothetical protein